MEQPKTGVEQPKNQAGERFDRIAWAYDYLIYPLERFGLTRTRCQFLSQVQGRVLEAGINLALLRQGRAGGAGRQGRIVSHAAMLKSLLAPKTGLMLMLNLVYYLNFAALFFLSKSLFESRGLGGVGLFFSIQTALMLVIRVLGSRLFDEVKKPYLILWCYALTALGFGMLWATNGLGMEVATALVLGLGMGVGPPSLNALMYGLSDAPMKAVNSNLMVMALQAGNFLGPILGGVAVGLMGYSGFLAVGIAANVGGMALCVLFLRRGWTGEARMETRG